MEDNEILTETPEEKAFFDSKGETVEAQPELKLEPEAKVEKIEATEEEKQPLRDAKPHQVPIGALLEEREKWSNKYSRLESRLEKLQELITPPAEPERVDPQVDPIKAIQHLNEKLERLEDEKKSVGEIQALAQFGQRQAQAYSQQKPDFYDAYNHLRNARATQLMDSGQVQSAQELNQRVLGEEQEIIKMCAKMSIDPAAFMYNLAMTAGYQGKQEAPKPQEPTQEEKIKIAAEGQARATSAASKAGGGTGGPIDLKALIGLSDEEFDKATSDPRKWRKVAGG